MTTRGAGEDRRPLLVPEKWVGSGSYPLVECRRPCARSPTTGAPGRSEPPHPPTPPPGRAEHPAGEPTCEVGRTETARILTGRPHRPAAGGRHARGRPAADRRRARAAARRASSPAASRTWSAWASPPASILAITFTNKAAGEMKKRVSNVLGRPIRDFGRLDQPWPTICTFHSLCLRILRHYADADRPAGELHDLRLGRPDQADQGSAQDAGHLQHQLPARHASTARSATPRTSSLAAEQFAAERRRFLSAAGRAGLHEIPAAAERRTTPWISTTCCCAPPTRSAIIPTCSRELQERFQYILIDEYQDTNHAQYVIAHALALQHRNICVVGDPDQSIYAWRGADIQNILEFEKDYPDAKVVRLEQNYRSTKTILAIASQADRQQHAAQGQGPLDGERRRARRPSCSSARTSTTRRTSSRSS